MTDYYKACQEVIQQIDDVYDEILSVKNKIEKMKSVAFQIQEIEDAKSLLDEEWFQHQDRHHDENEYLEK